MTPAERSSQLHQIANEAKHPGTRSSPNLEARIRAFEVRYEMTSQQLRERLRENSIRETADIAEWLFYLNASDCGVSA